MEVDLKTLLIVAGIGGVAFYLYANRPPGGTKPGLARVSRAESALQANRVLQKAEMAWLERMDPARKQGWYDSPGRKELLVMIERSYAANPALTEKSLLLDTPHGLRHKLETRLIAHMSGVK